MQAKSSIPVFLGATQSSEGLPASQTGRSSCSAPGQRSVARQRQQPTQQRPQREPAKPAELLEPVGCSVSGRPDQTMEQCRSTASRPQQRPQEAAQPLHPNPAAAQQRGSRAGQPKPDPHTGDQGSVQDGGDQMPSARGNRSRARKAAAITGGSQQLSSTGGQCKWSSRPPPSQRQGAEIPLDGPLGLSQAQGHDYCSCCGLPPVDQPQVSCCRAGFAALSTAGSAYLAHHHQSIPDNPMPTAGLRIWLHTANACMRPMSACRR